MINAEFPALLQQWANDILVWIGFGTLVGLLAGRAKGKTVVAILMGIGGTVLGCGALALFFTGNRVTPATPVGLLAASLGSATVFIVDRVLFGYGILARDIPTQRHAFRRPDSIRYHSAHHDDV